jgi:hypothetical protein
MSAGVSALAAFAHDWVGGDIHGLSALAGQCYGIAPKISEADSALTLRAGEMVCTAGWQGDAAGAFYAAWEKDSTAGSELASTWEAMGGIVDTLAVELAALENALERAAAVVEAQGVEVDPGTGNLEPTVTAATGAAAARLDKIMGAYASFRAAVLGRATAVRAAAATQLEALAGGLLPGAKGGGVGPLVSRLGNARALWAVPTTYRLALEERLPALEQAVQDAERAAVQQLMAARTLFGKGAPMPAAARDQLQSAYEELEEVQSRIDSAAGLESFSSQVAAGDAEGLADVLGGASGLVKAIPLAGTLAGSVETVVHDVLTGHSLGHGLIDAAASGGAGYGAGAGAAAVIGTGSLAATAGAAAAAGAAGAVAGDFAHHLVSDLGQEVSRHGLLDGTVQGVGDAASQTANDIGNVVSDIFG